MTQDDSPRKAHILNCGVGNIGSVSNMVEYLGFRPVLLDKPQELNSSDKLILPGVGKFDHGMQSLSRLGFSRSYFQDCVRSGVSILGICLGMQLMCDSSEEGSQQGLGLVDAHVLRFPSSAQPVPHMGWNSVITTKHNSLIDPSMDDLRFYFIHSYYVALKDPLLIASFTPYILEFCSSFQKGNIYGVQFHPEKSHRFGVSLFKRFLTGESKCCDLG